ncbi:transposase [Chryseobacterium sp. Bi04]|uniref:transposase n=1 Tax=Chryseobacterium sp. Bi04 TaxID=2822345 RepID=UPI001DC2D980|nr:transposase [Chryseobacterium sp. Bi04]CAH0191428.1 hypothetical protein SRABI04_01748 [Chryseobacterium sp. Bi04]
MNTHFKDIHIGKLIHQRIEEVSVKTLRICNFFNCTEEEVKKMLEQKDLSTDTLLKWCKLLEYDFFRVYSQHLILYSPPSGSDKKEKSILPSFRKSIYTREIIDFIMELVHTGEKSKSQIIEEYRIPKSTLYKWIEKYKG